MNQKHGHHRELVRNPPDQAPPPGDRVYTPREKPCSRTCLSHWLLGSRATWHFLETEPHGIRAHKALRWLESGWFYDPCSLSVAFLEWGGATPSRHPSSLTHLSLDNELLLEHNVTGVGGFVRVS